MRCRNFFKAILLLLTIGLLGQCDQFSDFNARNARSTDDDSDRPEWAQGNTDKNPHINRNEDSGTTRGGDYGDLYGIFFDKSPYPTTGNQ